MSSENKIKITIVPVADEGRTVLKLIAEQRLPKQVGVLATPMERLQWLLDDRSRLQLETAEAAQEINCSGPLAHRIRVLQQDHGRRVNRMETLIDAQQAALRTVGEYMDARRGNLALTDDETAELETMIALCFSPERTGLNTYLAELGDSPV